MKFCEERKVETIVKNELKKSAKFDSLIKYYSQGRRPLKFQMNWKKKIKRNSIDIRKIVLSHAFAGKVLGIEMFFFKMNGYWITSLILFALDVVKRIYICQGYIHHISVSVWCIHWISEYFRKCFAFIWRNLLLCSFVLSTIFPIT